VADGRLAPTGIGPGLDLLDRAIALLADLGPHGGQCHPQVMALPGAALPDGPAHGAGQDHQTTLLHGAPGVGEGDHGREAEVTRLSAHRLGQRVGIELTFRYGHQ